MSKYNLKNRRGEVSSIKIDRRKPRKKRILDLLYI